MVFLGEKSRFSHPHTNALPAFGWDESDAALAATIPFDGYARPILFSDGALIGLIVLPANAVERLEKSRLVAGHFPDFRATTSSTRFISWWTRGDRATIRRVAIPANTVADL